MKTPFFTLLLLFVAFALQANNQPNVRYKVVNGDTLFFVDLPVCFVGAEGKKGNFTSKRKQRKYNRLTFYVKKVLPYAKLASSKLREYESELLSAETEQERRKIMKNVEKALKDKYGDELKKLTITQGKILLKLIDRETGKTSYELVKEMRGGIAASMWQGLAVLFGQNLKSDYDPNSDDWMIEEIVQKIELGLI